MLSLYGSRSFCGTQAEAIIHHALEFSFAFLADKARRAHRVHEGTPLAGLRDGSCRPWIEGHQVRPEHS